MNILTVKNLSSVLHAGDIIKYRSMKACPTIDAVSRRQDVVAKGVVTKVYDRFCFVELNVITDCCNAWNILSINGKDCTEAYGGDALC